MRTKEMIDNLESHMSARLEGIEEALGKVVARGEIVDILQTELELMREERKELLNRLMARDFETLQTYTEGGEETVGEDIKDEENADMAGEVFEVPKTTV